MPTEVYEIIAQGARYWFLFLMALIVWRSFRWYRKDRRQYKKRLRLLPDAGYVGELVTIRGNAQLPTGTILPVPWEGIIGSGRGCDIFLPVPGVAPKHCWFSYDREDGLQLEPYHGRTVQVNDQSRYYGYGNPSRGGVHLVGGSLVGSDALGNAVLTTGAPGNAAAGQSFALSGSNAAFTSGKARAFIQRDQIDMRIQADGDLHIDGHHTIEDTAIALAKASPAIGVAATGVTGAIDWSAVAYMLTAIYMVLQILLLVPKYRQMLRDWKIKP